MTFRNFFQYSVVPVILLGANILPLTSPAAESVPLKVTLDIHDQVGFRPDCPSQFGGTMTGAGNSTHLGKVTFNATDCITPMEDHFTFKGDFSLVAADGDKFVGNYSGAFIPINSGSTYKLSDATVKITGGTGRFAQATGRAELTGTENVTTGKGTFEVDGSISY